MADIFNSSSRVRPTWNDKPDKMTIGEPPIIIIYEFKRFENNMSGYDYLSGLSCLPEDTLMSKKIFFTPKL